LYYVCVRNCILLKSIKLLLYIAEKPLMFHGFIYIFEVHSALRNLGKFRDDFVEKCSFPRGICWHFFNKTLSRHILFALPYCSLLIPLFAQALGLGELSLLFFVWPAPHLFIVLPQQQLWSPLSRRASSYFRLSLFDFVFICHIRSICASNLQV